MWEDNDALSVTDVFQMTEVSLNASVVLYIKALCYLTGWTANKLFFLSVYVLSILDIINIYTLNKTF